MLSVCRVYFLQSKNIILIHKIIKSNKKNTRSRLIRVYRLRVQASVCTEQCRSESISKRTKRNVCTEQCQSKSISKMTLCFLSAVCIHKAVGLPLLVALYFLSAVCIHKAVGLPLLVALYFLSAVCIHKAVGLPLLVALYFLSAVCIYYRVKI